MSRPALTLREQFDIAQECCAESVVRKQHLLSRRDRLLAALNRKAAAARRRLESAPSPSKGLLGECGEREEVLEQVRDLLAEYEALHEQLRDQLSAALRRQWLLSEIRADIIREMEGRATHAARRALLAAWHRHSLATGLPMTPRLPSPAADTHRHEFDTSIF